MSEVLQLHPVVELPNNQKQIRNMVSNYYDYQDLRIRTGNRLISAVRMDMPEEQKEEIKEKNKAKKKGEAVDDKDEKMLKLIMVDYHNIKDQMFERELTRKQLISHDLISKNGYIKNKTTFSLAEQFDDMELQEEKMLTVVGELVEEHPMWNAFFKDIKGCGPLMSGVILAYLNPYAARHVSSFWKYAGIDTVTVVKDGIEERVGRTKQYTELKAYTAMDGSIKEKNSLTYNPKLKTKLLGVLGSGFLKCKDYAKDGDGNSIIIPGSITDKQPKGKRQSEPAKYAKIYYDYKNRVENNPRHFDKTPAHIHAMSVRYMMQQFLRDLWVTWRLEEGLEISLPYEVAKLGMEPHGYNEFHVKSSTK